MQEINGTIHDFPAERADGGTVEVTEDELTTRRKARNAG
jgi:hypothetical protein